MPQQLPTHVSACGDKVIVGSITTGNLTVGSARNDASGVNSSTWFPPSPVNRLTIRPIRLPFPAAAPEALSLPSFVEELDAANITGSATGVTSLPAPSVSRR